MGDKGVYKSTILKCILKETYCASVDWIQLAHGPVMASCKHD
jgi:hypothetical protein